MTKIKLQHGFALIEVIVVLGFLIAIIGGVLLKVDSINNHIRQTERILAVDNLEQNIMELLSDHDTLIYSVKRAGNAALRNCLLSETATCQSGATYRQDFYLEGDQVAFTGPTVFYDHKGNRCSGQCEGVRVITSVNVRCAQGNSCNQPLHTTVRYEIFATGQDQAMRKDFIDIKRYSDGKFPGISLSCRSPQQVLRGIGINGQALCVNRNQIKLQSQDGEKLSGNFNVAPRDCSQLNQAEKDQSFILGITEEGTLLCGERFW